MKPAWGNAGVHNRVRKRRRAAQIVRKKSKARGSFDYSSGDLERRDMGGMYNTEITQNSNPEKTEPCRDRLQPDPPPRHPVRWMPKIR